MVKIHCLLDKKILGEIGEIASMSIFPFKFVCTLLSLLLKLFVVRLSKLQILFTITNIKNVYTERELLTNGGREGGKRGRAPKGLVKALSNAL